MEKLMYLLERTPGTDMQVYADTLLNEVIPQVQARSVGCITLNIADLDAELRQQSPGRIAGNWQELGGVLSFWLQSLDSRDAIEKILENFVPAFQGFLVTESIPQDCEQTWVDGERRPGVAQFTALGKPADVSEADFYYNWQVKHSAISFDLHPRRWSYVRNAVARPLTPNALPYRSLVLEHFRELADFTDDSRYFGRPEVVEEMYADLPGFCDATSMVTGGMSEYSFQGRG